MSQDGKILGSIALADTLIVFTKCNIQDPVQGVLNTPMLSGMLQDLSRAILITGNEIAVFNRMRFSEQLLGRDGKRQNRQMAKTIDYTPSDREKYQLVTELLGLEELDVVMHYLRTGAEGGQWRVTHPNVAILSLADAWRVAHTVWIEPFQQALATFHSS